ncbi:MAG: hypothetical protein U0235_02250 [Polyangiaceae bacterium]
MRHRGLLVGLLSLSAVLGASCTRNPNTEYVAGFSTQIQVPKYFKSIEVSVFIGNDKTQQLAPSPLGCEHIPVVNGVARLPKTFGIYRQTDAQSMMVSVIGFTDDAETVAKQRVDCAVNPGKTEGDAQILRRSRQSYRDGKVLYLPMPLKYACYGVTCGNPGDPQTGTGAQGEQTCVAGKCVSAKRSEFVFRDYSPDLAFGDSSACFSSNRCMADAIDPKVEDADKCIYSVPGTADGMNVRVIYDGFVPEMLDLDNVLPPGFDQLSAEQQAEVKADLSQNQEGFTILGPGKFQLAPGLCELTKSGAKGHRILGLAASRSCAPKSNPMPLCDEGLEILQPAPSRVYVLLDRSSDMQQMLSESAINQALSLSLDDAVFSTTEVGFHWLPGKVAGETCPTSTSYQSPNVPFLKAVKARDQIVETELKKLGSFFPPSTSLEPALKTDGAFAALTNADKKAINRQALFIITNASVGEDCAGNPTESPGNAINATKNDITTYLVELGVPARPTDPPGTSYTTPESPLRLKHDEQAKVLGSKGARVYLATSGLLKPGDPDANVVPQALADLVKDLSSCLYERPLSVTDSSTLKLATNVNPQEIPRNPNCSAATRDTADGWNVEGPNDSLIRICGSSCERVHTDTGTLNGLATLRKAKRLSGDNSATPDAPPALFVTATAPVKKP